MLLVRALLPRRTVKRKRTVLADCTRYSNQAGQVLDMTAEKRAELEALILTMVRRRWLLVENCWIGLALLGLAWLGLAWLGLAWVSLAWRRLSLPSACLFLTLQLDST